MNKILFRLIGVIAVAIYSVSAYAETFEVDGIYYKTDYKDKTIAVVTSGTNKYSGEVVIPETVEYKGNTLRVTTIGSSAFANSTDLTSVKLPNTITSIEIQAFRGCTGITNISIPNSVISMGASVFYGCSSLASFEWSSALHVIPSGTFNYCSSLLAVQIPNHILRIGDNAFANCKKLQDITIGSSVTEIGKQVFQSCEKLESIDIPSSVKTIGFWAFRSSAIKTVTIPSNVVSIGEGCFSACYSLETVELSEGLDTIGNKCFDGCNLTSINIPSSVRHIGVNPFVSCDRLERISVTANSRNYCSVDGVLYSADKDTLLAFPKAKGKEYACQTETKVIAPYTFYSSNISHIILNEGLVSIEEGAFNSNSYLQSITFPSTLTVIGKKAFDYTNLNGIISKIQNPVDVLIDAFSQEIYEKTTLYIPKGTMSLYLEKNGWKEFKKIKESGLYEADGLKYEIDFNTNTAILLGPVDENYDDFDFNEDNNYDDIEFDDRIVVPDSIPYQGKSIPVVKIAENAFKEQYQPFSSLTLSKNIKEIGDNAFYGCWIDTVIVRNPTPISIAENVFKSVYNHAILIVPQKTKAVYSITRPWSKFSTIKEIDSEVVEDGLLYEIDFNSNTATLIKKNTYVYSSDEIDVPETIPYNNQQIPVTRIAEDAFKSTNLKSIIFSKNISVIGNNAFNGCTNLKKIFVRNETPIAINENVFEGVYDKATLFVPQGFLAQYQQAEVWKKFSTIQEEQTGDTETEGGFRVGGIYYEIDTATPINVRVVKNPDGYKGTITIPSQVTFNGSTYKVSEIGKSAFQSSKVESIDILEGVTTISENAFFLCGNLNHVSLPMTLTTIGHGAFRSTAISEIEIPTSVTSIGIDAFINCTKLMSIRVNEGNLVYNSRGNCNAIIQGTVLIAGCNGTSVVPTGITEIGEDAFIGTIIKSILLPSSLKTIGKSAFQSSKVESIDIPEGVTTISENAFFLCGNLNHVSLPMTLTTIGHGAFRSTAISEIEIPASITSIGTDLLTNCSNLVVLVVNHTEPLQIDNNLFSGLYDKVILYVPIGTVDLYRQANGWKNFANIQEIEPDPMPVIDNKTYVIHKRTGLADLQTIVSDEHVVVPETIVYDGKPYTVTRILDSAFMGSIMISLSIPKSITYVGMDVIKDCHRLAAIDWNPTFKPSDEFVSNIENPNLLFYVTDGQYKPNGIRNVVVREQANSITLTDEKNGNFYCPKAFTADNITYTHNYSMPTEKDKCQGWESIVLPFDVTTIKTANGEEIKPVSIAGTGEKRFWLKELKETGLEEANEIKANVPYIISMPNWDGYQNFYNITGDVTFSAQNVTVQPSDNLQISTSGIYQFKPNYQAQDKQNGIWALNTSEYAENGKTYAPGSIFKANLRNVRPFEAYLTDSGSAAARRCISIADLMDGATAIADIPVRGKRIYSDNGIIYIESAADGSCNIYSMSGQLMRKLALKKGTNVVGGLTKGVYIVNGNKVMVR